MSNRYHVIREDSATGEFQDWHTVNTTDPEDAAVRTAEYDHAHHDGWEWTWPVIYLVVDDNGRAWTVDVAREHVPEFFDSGAEDVPLPTGAMPPIEVCDANEVLP